MSNTNQNSTIVVYEPTEDNVIVEVLGAVIDVESGIKGTKVHKISYEDFKQVLESTVDNSTKIVETSQNEFDEIINQFGVESDIVCFPSNAETMDSEGNLVQVVKGNSKFPSILAYKDTDEFSSSYPMCTDDVIIKSKVTYSSSSLITVTNLEAFIFTGILYRSDLENETNTKKSDLLTEYLQEKFEGKQLEVEKFDVDSALKQLINGKSRYSEKEKNLITAIDEANYELENMKWY